jgi:hypothetical protein
MKSRKWIALLALALSLGMLLSLVPATSGAFAQSVAQSPMQTTARSAIPATGMSLPAITLPKKVSLKLKQKIKINRLNVVIAPRVTQNIKKLNVIVPRINTHMMVPRTMWKMKAHRHIAAMRMMPRSGRGMVNVTNKLSKSSQIVANRSVNIILNVKNLILAHSVVTNCKSCR